MMDTDCAPNVYWRGPNPAHRDRVVLGRICPETTLPHTINYGSVQLRHELTRVSRRPSTSRPSESHGSLPVQGPPKESR